MLLPPKFAHSTLSYTTHENVAVAYVEKKIIHREQFPRILMWVWGGGDPWKCSATMHPVKEHTSADG